MKELGYFHPRELRHSISVYLGKTDNSLYLTNVDCFICQVKAFLYSHSPAPNNKRQVVLFRSDLLTGSAYDWWLCELSGERRRQLETAGIK